MAGSAISGVSRQEPRGFNGSSSRANVGSNGETPAHHSAGRDMLAAGLGLRGPRLVEARCAYTRVSYRSIEWHRTCCWELGIRAKGSRQVPAKGTLVAAISDKGRSSWRTLTWSGNRRISSDVPG